MSFSRREPGPGWEGSPLLFLHFPLCLSLLLVLFPFRLPSLLVCLPSLVVLIVPLFVLVVAAPALMILLWGLVLVILDIVMDFYVGPPNIVYVYISAGPILADSSFR